MTSPFPPAASSSPNDAAPAPPVSQSNVPSTRLTLLEQVIAAEMAYGQQFTMLTVTLEDEAAWQQAQRIHHVLLPVANELPRWCLPFARFVLERHNYSLHHYMARRLSLEAWACWFAQGGILMPFC